MAPQHPDSCLNVELMGEVMVARFTHEVILHGQQAEAVSEQLTDLVAQGGRRLLLDCANVQSLSSRMLGKLIELRRATADAGGRLALFNLRPPVREILEVSGLNRIIPLFGEEQEALRSI